MDHKRIACANAEAPRTTAACHTRTSTAREFAPLFGVLLLGLEGSMLESGAGARTVVVLALELVGIGTKEVVKEVGTAGGVKVSTLDGPLAGPLDGPLDDPLDGPLGDPLDGPLGGMVDGLGGAGDPVVTTGGGGVPGVLLLLGGGGAGEEFASPPTPQAMAWPFGWMRF